MNQGESKQIKANQSNFKLMHRGGGRFDGRSSQKGQEVGELSVNGCEAVKR